MEHDSILPSNFCLFGLLFIIIIIIIIIIIMLKVSSRSILILEKVRF